MFLIVGTLARKKSYHKQLDVEVGRYIKGLETARREARLEEVKRTRIMWPGNFVASPDNQAPDDVTSEDKVTSDSNERDDCVFLPATTVAPPEDSDSDDSALILPATTVIIVDEPSDKSVKSSSSDEHLEQDPTLLTVPNNKQFNQTKLEECSSSNLSLKKYNTLSNEDLLNAYYLAKGRRKSLSYSGLFPVKNQDSSRGKMQRFYSVCEKDKPKFDLQRFKKLSVPAHIKGSVTDSNWDSDHGALTPKIQRRKSRSRRFSKSSLHAALHKKSRSSKNIDSGESGDDSKLEEYRNSPFYRMRSRGRRLLDDRQATVSSPEDSPLNGRILLPNKRLLLLSQQQPSTDLSDMEDAELTRYKQSAGYQSRTRARRTAVI
jgi:hypothetical protein